MSLLSEFRDGPFAFANKYPLSIPGPGTIMHFKQKAFQTATAQFTGYQVAGAERIYWFDIGRTKGDPSMAEVQMQPEPDETLETAYWLPWEENEIVRVALRPSSKASGALKGVDPDYFFTAPLQGCSVFVEGTREQPIVYHANARLHGGTFDNLTKRQFLELQRSKVEEMQKRYAAFSTQHEKLSRGHERKGPGQYGSEASMIDYLSRAHSPDFPSELEEVVSKATKGQFTKIEIAGQKIVVTHAEGTVFGVREDGEWTFYYQKRVRIQHLVNDYETSVSKQGVIRKGFSYLWPGDWVSWSNASWRVQAEMWLPLACEEFWPGGKGSFVIRA